MSDDDPFEQARDRGARLIQGLDDEERTAFIARALINAACQNSKIPHDLRPQLHETAERLAEETTLDPDQVAIEAFRRHGYRAEMKTIGESMMLTATRVQD